MRVEWTDTRACTRGKCRGSDVDYRGIACGMAARILNGASEPSPVSRGLTRVATDYGRRVCESARGQHEIR